MRRIVALLDPPTDIQRYSDDADVSRAAGKPVKDATGRVIGNVVRAFTRDGGLYAEMDIEDAFADRFGMGAEL